MRVYGIVYGKRVLGFCPHKNEAFEEGYRYAAKVGPDKGAPRKKHFVAWLKVHDMEDGPLAWSQYVNGLEDKDVGVMVIDVPMRSIKPLVCLGLNDLQDDVSKAIGGAPADIKHPKAIKVPLGK